MRIDTSCIAGTTVAFHAKLKNPISSLSPNQIIKYDDVITNIGEGYDRTTGKFTAPMDGVYSFFLDLHDKERSKSVHRRDCRRQTNRLDGHV